MNDHVPTTHNAYWCDPDVEPPPLNTKLNLLTKYGIAQYGVFIPDYHIGWSYCLKIPPNIKRKLQERT